MIWRIRRTSPTRPSGRAAGIVDTSSIPFLLRAMPHQVEHFVHRAAQRKRRFVDVQASGLDFRHVENVVKDGKQRISGILRRFQVPRAVFRAGGG